MFSSDAPVDDPALRALLARDAGDFRALCQLGFEKQQGGDLRGARQCYELAERTAPPSRELAHNLGVVCRQLGDAPAARSHLERALALDGASLATLDELALLHQESGDLLAALSCYERILAIAPRHAQAFTGMGMAFSDAGWEEDAIRSFQTALEIQPGNLEATNGLAVIFKRQGRYQEAIDRFDQLLAQCPGNAGLQRNKAMVLGALGLLAEEEAVYRQILARDAQDADAHFGLASVLLMQGRFPEGWREYEWRFVSRQSGEAIRSPVTRLPRWSGEALPDGATGLVINVEQGFGDGIQFSRFVPMAAARFGRVRLQTRAPLQSLFQRSFGALAEVVVASSDESAYSHHCPLLSLPLALGVTLATLPGEVPYLKTDASRAAVWASRLASESRPKVGLVWMTGKRGMHKRSFEPLLADLEPLLAGADVCWVSLNKVPLDAGQQGVLARHGVLDWTDALSDFDETAALISALDLVISVDTAVAHLAGALGKPVWLLNRAESEWRWLRDRDDSPWYPTMRIFRLQQSRQWAPVLASVGAALSGLAGSHE